MGEETHTNFANYSGLQHTPTERELIALKRKHDELVAAARAYTDWGLAIDPCKEEIDDYNRLRKLLEDDNG